MAADDDHHGDDDSKSQREQARPKPQTAGLHLEGNQVCGQQVDGQRQPDGGPPGNQKPPGMFCQWGNHERGKNS